MAKYFNITSATTTTLAQASDYTINSTTNKRSTNNVTISKIIVNNADDANAAISVWLDGTTDYYVISGLSVPATTTFIWDTPFTFNASTHTLKLTNTGGASPVLYVILS
jgi:hypothetical protein